MLTEHGQKFIDDEVERFLGFGCPKCGEATELVASMSMEFPDGSIFLEVDHNCHYCHCAHASAASSGGEARRYRKRWARERGAQMLAAH